MIDRGPGEVPGGSTFFTTPGAPEAAMEGALVEPGSLLSTRDFVRRRRHVCNNGKGSLEEETTNLI